jgi:hypothetical protein
LANVWTPSYSWQAPSSIFLQFVQDIWGYHGTQVGINSHNSRFITENGKRGFEDTRFRIFISLQTWDFTNFELQWYNVAWAPYEDYWRHAHKVNVLTLFTTRRIEGSKNVRDEELYFLIQIILRIVR